MHPVKICFVTPWPPHEGGVALHSYELVGHLVALYPHLAITVVTVCDNPQPLPGVDVIGVKGRQDLPDFAQFEHMIHVLTNHIYTNISFDLLKEVGGTVLTHETNVHQRLIVNSELCEAGFRWDSYKYLSQILNNSKKKRAWFFLKAIIREYGFKWAFKNIKLKKDFASIRRDISKQANYMDYIATYANQVICLSKPNADAICAYTGMSQDRVSHIRFGHNPSTGISSEKHEGGVFGLFGNEGEVKHYEVVIKAFEILCKLHPKVSFRLHIVGNISDCTLRRIKKLGILDKVKLVYKPCNKKWNTELAQVDALISLRYPTIGEASGPVCQAAQMGVKSIVSNTGWFATLPDWLAYKVDPLGSIVSLIDAMQRVHQEGVAHSLDDNRKQVATRAREYFSMQKSAQELGAVIGVETSKQKKLAGSLGVN